MKLWNFFSLFHGRVEQQILWNSMERMDPQFHCAPTVQQSTAPWQERTESDYVWQCVVSQICDSKSLLCLKNMTHRRVPILFPSDQPITALQQKTEKQKMKKKIEQKWMKDQKKQINFQKKKRSLRKMKRSSEKQRLPRPLFGSFSALIIAKGLPGKSMAVHGPAV